MLLGRLRGRGQCRDAAMTDFNVADQFLLRPTGIPVLGNVPWGAHICVFYETKEDLLEVTLPYLAAGLAHNEFCVWAVSAPIDEEAAADALARALPDFASQRAAGQIEILEGYGLYLGGGQFDLGRIMRTWQQKLEWALARGYDGLRVTGNAFWFEIKRWKAFCEYEEEVDSAIASKQMILMCTYALEESGASEILDVTRAHNCALVRREGQWEFLEPSGLRQAMLKRRQGIGDALWEPFQGADLLTPRERIVLTQLTSGGTGKEVGRALGISPRTVEFHRSNIMRKLGARNLVDLVRKVGTTKTV
jgi:DNA-binding CsgD family transcriptional regulator